MQNLILKTQELAGKEGSFNFTEAEPTPDYLCEKIISALRNKSLADNKYQEFIKDMPDYYNLVHAIEKAGIADITGKPKFFKRLQKAYREITTQKLPDIFGGIIGDAHKQALSALTINLWYQITNDIQNIGAGYGNNHSCWYGYDSAYCHAPEILEANEGIGILIFNHERKEQNDGIGRIWGINTPDGIAYFNPYLDLSETGISRNKMDCSKFKIFMNLIALEIMKLTQLENDEYTSADKEKFLVVDINLDGSHIFVNDNHAQIITSQPDKVRRHYTIDAGDYCLIECIECGRDLDEDDVTYNEDGEAYCERCYNDKYTHCAHCENELYIQDGITTKDDELICKRCSREYYTECDECGMYVSNDDINQADNGKYICEACMEDNYFTCEQCGRIEPKTNENIINQGNYTDSICDLCIEDYTNDEQKLTLIDAEIKKIRAKQEEADYKIDIQYLGEYQTITRTPKYYTDADLIDLFQAWNRDNRHIKILSITKGILNLTEKIMKEVNIEA